MNATPVGQPSLLDYLATEPEPEPEPVPALRSPGHVKDEGLAADFWEFHLSNPEIYRLLCRFAREAKGSGRRKKYGIAAIFERVRWHVEVDTDGDDFKLNNNYRAFYARLIMRDEPDLAGFFEIRRQSFE